MPRLREINIGRRALLQESSVVKPWGNVDGGSGHWSQPREAAHASLP
jgi:hypothetical protein